MAYIQDLQVLRKWLMDTESVIINHALILWPIFHLEEFTLFDLWTSSCYTCITEITDRCIDNIIYGERERADANSGLVALFSRTWGVLCKIANVQERQKSRQNQATDTLALPCWLEAALDGKWAFGKQVDKFRGRIFEFASSWTKVAQADKLKSRQCI